MEAVSRDAARPLTLLSRRSAPLGLLSERAEKLLCPSRPPAPPPYPPRAVRDAVAAPGPAALADWRGGRRRPPPPALLLPLLRVCGGATKERGSAGCRREGGVCARGRDASCEEKAQGQEAALLLHGRRAMSPEEDEEEKGRMAVGCRASPREWGAGGGVGRRERRKAGGKRRVWISPAGLFLLSGSSRLSAHGPRGQRGAGQRPEQSWGRPSAPGRLETFPLRLLLLLLRSAGRQQLAVLLRIPLPGPLCPGVPVQVLRQDLLLLGALCQLYLRLRPGLGGRSVPALPGQVQVSLRLLPLPFLRSVLMLFLFYFPYNYFLWFCSRVMERCDRSWGWNSSPAPSFRECRTRLPLLSVGAQQSA